MLNYTILCDGRQALSDQQFSWKNVEEAAADLTQFDDWDVAWLSDSSSAWTIRHGDPVQVEESGWIGDARRYLSREEYECMVEYDGDDAVDRCVKFERACEESGYRGYPSTMDKIVECVRDSLGDEYEDAFETMTAKQLGYLFKASKGSYERGRRDGA